MLNIRDLNRKSKGHTELLYYVHPDGRLYGMEIEATKCLSGILPFSEYYI